MSRIPDFTKLDFEPPLDPADEKKWQDFAEKEAKKQIDQLSWQTNEQIAVKPLYTAKD
jgi:methylmalonyl-CoA mutase